MTSSANVAGREDMCGAFQDRRPGATSTPWQIRRPASLVRLVPVARWGAVQASGGQPDEVNVHVAWRMAVASRAARAYAGNGKLAALAVAGSVGAGLADRFSDLELDCYWSSPPGDPDRIGPIGALGGELTGFWEYDEDDHEWSEDYLLGDLGVTVSNSSPVRSSG